MVGSLVSLARRYLPRIEVGEDAGKRTISIKLLFRWHNEPYLIVSLQAGLMRHRRPGVTTVNLEGCRERFTA